MASDDNAARQSFALATEIGDVLTPARMSELRELLHDAPVHLRRDCVPVVVYQADSSCEARKVYEDAFAELLINIRDRIAAFEASGAHQGPNTNTNPNPNAEMVFLALPVGFAQVFQILPSATPSAFKQYVGGLNNRRDAAGRFRVQAIRIGLARGFSLVLVHVAARAQAWWPSSLAWSPPQATSSALWSLSPVRTLTSFGAVCLTRDVTPCSCSCCIGQNPSSICACTRFQYAPRSL